MPNHLNHYHLNKLHCYIVHNINYCLVSGIKTQTLNLLAYINQVHLTMLFICAIIRLFLTKQITLDRFDGNLQIFIT